MKAYYLLQFAYWLQQMLLLCLRVEKPRSDFVELCIHVRSSLGAQGTRLRFCSTVSRCGSSDGPT